MYLNVISICIIGVVMASAVWVAEAKHELAFGCQWVDDGMIDDFGWLV